MVLLVEVWYSKGIENIFPPQLVTSALPTISSTGQSPPLTKISGFIVLMRFKGVSSSKLVTRSTHSSAAMTAIRSSVELIGLSSPLPSLLTELSELIATMSEAPRALAWARYVTWPRCRMSNTPLVNT